MMLFFNGWGFALEPEPQTGQLKLRSYFPYIIIIIIIKQIIVSVNYIYTIWKLLLCQSGIKQVDGLDCPHSYL